METKKCSKCGEEKELTEFWKDNRSLSGYVARCKSCIKEYRENNREKIINAIKDWRTRNPNKCKEWNELNKEYRKEYMRKWREDNKKHRSLYANNYRKNKKETDRLFKITDVVRHLVNRNIKANGFSKTSNTAKILGCTYEFFKEYIESKFTKGMSWDNYGINGWHLDHIIPSSSAKTEEEIIKLNHYTNFQPLWAKENISKSNKMPDIVQFKLM